MLRSFARTARPRDVTSAPYALSRSAPSRNAGEALQALPRRRRPALGRDGDGALRQSGIDDRSQCGGRARVAIDIGKSLAHSWELIEVDLGGGAELVGINTAHPNALAAEAITAGAIPE